MKQNSTVPAFLTKLWTLVEDSDTNEFICWSQEGNSFLVLDEQRFAKEILPKYFKHNNMASFIRQLNMYGFRKVMHIDTGVVKQERDGPVEFQHPYFKHGQDDLLENIKRKVSNTRPEDNKIRQEDLSKILASVQSVHSKQENIDARLATLKRQNEALWREISDLRQKHAHQQQLIKKLIHFIITLVQSNRILNLKRKRSILMNGNGKKPKYIHEIYDDQACVEQTSGGSLNGVKSSDISDDVVICDVTESKADAAAEITEESQRVFEHGDVEIVEVELDSCGMLSAETEFHSTCMDDVRQTEADVAAGDSRQTETDVTAGDSRQTETDEAAGDSRQTETDEAAGDSRQTETDEAAGDSRQTETDVAAGDSHRSSSDPTSSALQLNKPSALSLEDPVKMMDSILNENGAISQNISLLGKLELMDYLDSIDCSLEDFQAMLYEKHFGIDFDALEENVSSKDSSSQANRGRTEENNTDKQLIQYTCCPLLAFLDGCAPPLELDLGPAGTTSTDCSCPPPSSSVEVEPLSDLLDSSLESKQPVRSSLIRLEPLTEAEASEETLFYLCELSPAGAESDSTQMS